MILGLYDCADLDSHAVIKAFFAELLKDLEMKALDDIKIITVDNNQGHGTSAIQLITTSSITYHADDKYRNAFIDVFSCKSFDPNIVINSIEKYFKPKHIQYKFIKRAEQE